MRDHLRDHNVDYYWTNAGHQLADGFTKLSTANARSDLLLQAISTGTIRITYSEESGKKEAKRLKDQAEEGLFGEDLDPEANQMFSMNIDDDETAEGHANMNTKLDNSDRWYYDLE